MSRGNRRQKRFLDDVDRQDFLKTLGEACEKTAWEVHASCMMSNHFHWVVETPQPNLVFGMKWLSRLHPGGIGDNSPTFQPSLRD